MIALPKSEYLWTGESYGASDYEASQGSKTRSISGRPLVSEDRALPEQARKRVVKSVRDLRRNYAVARWAINCHLDFVVAHTFKPKTGDESLDRTLTGFVKKASRKANFDQLKKHPRRRFMRLLEASRTVDGDVFSVKRPGGLIQAVEGDRVRSPFGIRHYHRVTGSEKWVHGIRVNAAGEETAIAIHRRTGNNSFTPERVVNMANVISLGYFDRFDQRRGVSPVACAINPLKDTHESFDYSLQKEKIRSLFCFSIYRDSDWGIGAHREGGDYEIDFRKGPQFLELDEGDRGEFLHSNDPGQSTQDFWEWQISIALKSLDIPYSFFREDFTNFHGSKAAETRYLNSVFDKRADIRDWSDDWLCWRLMVGREMGEIDLPRSFDCDDPDQWAWIPRGRPWWDPRDVNADIQAIAAGLKTREQVRYERFGDSWVDDVAPQLEAEEKIIADRDLHIATNSNPVIEMVSND